MLHRQLPVATGHTLIAPGELGGKGGVPEQEDLSGCRGKVKDPLVRGAREGRWLQWQVGAGTPCWARPGSGPGCWPLRVRVGLLVAQQCPCQVQQPPGLPGSALLCWHLGLGAMAKRLRGTSPLLGGSGNEYSRSAHCQPPATPSRNPWRAPRWDGVFTCACFHVYFQHKREAPQVEGGRVCRAG